jgi:hypothetical protein
VGQYVTFFDDYNRDFKMQLQTTRSSLSSMLYREMDRSGLGNRDALLSHIKNDTWSLKSSYSGIGEPALEGLAWQFSLINKLGTTKLGYGRTTGWFYQPEGLPVMTAEEDVTTSGVNPILQLAANGTHISNRIDLGQNLSLTAGFAANRKKADVFKQTAKARMFMVSATGYSSDNQIVGNVTATRLIEEDGLLGSRLTGAFSQGDAFDTTSLTFSGDWKLGSGYVLSGSYTLARSDTDGGNNGLLRISNRVISDAFAVGFMKRGITSDKDQVYVSVSQPLRISTGAAQISHDDNYDGSGNLNRRTVDINLAPAGREIDLQFGYATSLKKSSRMKALFYRAENYNHVAGNYDSGGLVRFDWDF